MRSLVLFALAAVLMLPSIAGAAITYDGVNIPADFTGLLKATQVNGTGYGDTSGVSTGSELDQMYVARSADGIYLAVTGNLETNGNAYVILLQTAPGGTNVLSATNGPGALSSLSGTTLDVDFAPNWAITINTWGGTMYANITDLVGNVDKYLGASGVNSGYANLDGNIANLLGTYNNTNIAGVTENATKTAEQNEADAATAETGFELHLPFSLLNITDPSAFTSMKVMVILDGGGGWLSNQTLPSLPTGQGNLGQGGTAINFANFPGDQYATVDVSTPTTNAITVDGTGIPADFAGHLVAAQSCHTGFGDRTGEEGSELDQLFMGQDASGLQIGITGNLRSSGDFWMIFLESGPGGQHVFTIPDGVGPESGVLQGMRGTTFYTGLNPTHALCINLYGGKAYVDLVDFRNSTTRYLGYSLVNSNSGTLQEGDNLNGAVVALNNTNAAGVIAYNPMLEAGDPTSATAGAEIYLPFADLGLAACSIKATVLLTGNKGSISNQALPSFYEGTPNFESYPVNFESWTQDLVEVPINAPTFAAVSTVQEAKSKVNSSPVLLSNVRVSASFTDSGLYYVQDPTSPAGIAVYDSATVPAEGALVTVKGYMTYASGERAISACETTIIEQPGSAHSKPLGMGNKVLGGAAQGDNPGIAGAQGVGNLGALVKTWGRVTSVDPEGKFFYLDDGSGVLDGTLQADGTTPNVGVRLLSTKPVAVNNYVAVTGLSSVFTTYDAAFVPIYNRAVRARTDADVQILH